MAGPKPDPDRPETEPGRPVRKDTFATQYDLRILQAFRRIIRAVDLDSKRLAGEHDITGPQLVCLRSLVDLGPVSSSQLAQAVHLSLSTVVGILDRLEKKGLVLRSRDATDRRVVHAVATAAGAELLERAPSPLHQKLGAGLRALPELEQTNIALVLERVLELIEAQELDAAPMLASGPLDTSPPVQRPGSHPAKSHRDDTNKKPRKRQQIDE